MKINKIIERIRKLHDQGVLDETTELKVLINDVPFDIKEISKNYGEDFVVIKLEDEHL